MITISGVRAVDFHDGAEAVRRHAGGEADGADGGRQRALFSALYSCGRGHASKAPTLEATVKPKASAKLGCPWQLTPTCMRSRPETVLVQFPVEHQGHQPGSAEGNALLRPNKEAVARMHGLLLLGLKPMAVISIMDSELDKQLLGQPGSSFAASYTNPRRRVRQEDVRRAQKALCRDNLIDANDVRATSALVETLQQADQETVLLYSPQKVGDKGVVVQPLVVIISSPFSAPDAKGLWRGAGLPGRHRRAPSSTCKFLHASSTCKLRALLHAYCRD